MGANWTQAQQKAAEVRKKYPGDNPPVNAFDIAAGEGIQIVYFNPTDKTRNIAGVFASDSKTIFLNSDSSPERQNFTLAHELAHHFLNHKPNEYGVNWRSQHGINKPEKEKEADCFAAELLMPSTLIRKVQKDLQLQDADAVALAKIFGVSPVAMRYRLKDLINGRAGK